MTQSIQELEAQLAAARAEQVKDDQLEASLREVAAQKQAKLAAIELEISDADAGIRHLEEKISARRARIAGLRQQLAAEQGEA